MADLIYNGFKKAIQDGTDLVTGTVKVMLVTSLYTPDRDLHVYQNVVTNEVTGLGYTAGGATLAGKSVTQDNTGDLGKFDADDIFWSGSTITARGAVLYHDTGTPSTSPLICYIDFGVDKVTSNSEFLIEWHTNGILTLS